LPPEMKWQWHGGAMGNDKALYAIPCNASKVLRVDTETDALTFIGDLGEHGSLKNKWYGGIKDRNGAIWGIPYCSDKVLKITPETQSVEMFDVSGETLKKNAFSWHGGTLAPDGCIYGFPSHAERVLKINCNTGEISLIGDSLGTDGYKFGGGCIGGDGNVYAFPSDYHAVLKIDVATGKTSLLGVGEPSMMPSLKNKWQGGVLARDGSIYGIPCDAPSVLCIDVAAQRVFFLGALGDLPDKYQGGFLDANDGVIYAIPENAPNIMRICPRGSTPAPPARVNIRYDIRPARASSSPCISVSYQYTRNTTTHTRTWCIPRIVCHARGAMFVRRRETPRLDASRARLSRGSPRPYAGRYLHTLARAPRLGAELDSVSTAHDGRLAPELARGRRHDV
jgi:hypothetical protein